MNHHALAVDVADLQVCYLSTAQTGSVERHEQSAMEGSASGIDEACDFFLAEDRWKVMVLFRIGSLGDAPGFLERLDVENNLAAVGGGVNNSQFVASAVAVTKNVTGTSTFCASEDGVVRKDPTGPAAPANSAACQAFPAMNSNN